MSCQAEQQGDEMACGRCGLRWDVADQDRPACINRRATERPAAPVVTPHGFNARAFVRARLAGGRYVDSFTIGRIEKIALDAFNEGKKK